MAPPASVLIVDDRVAHRKHSAPLVLRRPRLRHVLGALVLLVATFSSSSLRAETWVIPHVIYHQGTIAQTYNFDMSLQAALSGAGGGLEGPTLLELYLFDDNGNYVMDAAPSPVCNPCQLTLSAATSSLADGFRFDSLFLGGFPQPLMTGFAVVVASGDTAHLGLETFLVNSVSGPFDTHLFSNAPTRILAGNTPDIWLIPYFIIHEGTINDANNFDATLFATYVGGSRVIPEGTGVSMCLYLYRQDGTLMPDALGENVCAPCIYLLDGSNPKETIRFDSLFSGGQARPIESGYAVITVGGDIERLAFQMQLQNSHSGPFDVSITELPLEPVQFTAPASPGVEPVRSSAAPNPFSTSVEIAFQLPTRSEVRVSVIDVQGREVATLVDATLNAGPHTRRWDGRDSAGRIMPAGVYFARVDLGGTVLATQKLMLIP